MSSQNERAFVLPLFLAFMTLAVFLAASIQKRCYWTVRLASGQPRSEHHAFLRLESALSELEARSAGSSGLTCVHISETRKLCGVGRQGDTTLLGKDRIMATAGAADRYPRFDNRQLFSLATRCVLGEQKRECAIKSFNGVGRFVGSVAIAGSLTLGASHTVETFSASADARIHELRIYGDAMVLAGEDLLISSLIMEKSARLTLIAENGLLEVSSLSGKGRLKLIGRDGVIFPSPTRYGDNHLLPPLAPFSLYGEADS